jgi:hypothetical protein
MPREISHIDRSPIPSGAAPDDAKHSDYSE